MKKFKILIPVFNDWDSLEKLLEEINIAVKDIKKISFSCIIIDDASTIQSPNIKVPTNITSIEIVNMRENRGHARCNAFGLRYVVKNSKFDNLIVMDGDGEDRPEEIKFLVEKSLLEPNISVVAKRIKRSEGPFFQFLYQVHKLITLIFTGKKINFGNYSCLTFNDVRQMSSDPSLWSSFSGTLKKNLKNYNEIDSIRGQRYFGPSKMSLFNLGIHSLSIIAVFKKFVFLRSTILIFLISYFSNQQEYLTIFTQILLIIFSLLIYLVSLRENEKELLNSHNNLKDSYTYTH